MVAPVVIVLIIIVIIAVILYVVTMALFLSTANQLEGTDKTYVQAAGAMIGVAIPLMIIGAIFGLLYFSQLRAGKKNPLYLWMFIIMVGLAAILISIASIIGWIYGGRLDGTSKRNVQAASAISLSASVFAIVAFVMMLILSKKKVTEEVRGRFNAVRSKNTNNKNLDSMRKGVNQMETESVK